ncbi:MAG: hypothetical protein ACE5KS_00115 [Woeseiaceae bacterium]
MKIKNLLLVLVLVMPVSVQADPLLGKDLAGDRKLPRAFGVGIDYFEMDQPYQIDSLSFAVPIGVPLPPITNVSSIVVENEVTHVDIKFDVWLLPFLNVFAIYGQIDGETVVDLSNVGIPLLPPEVQTLMIDYDGDVYGGGLVLAVGGDRWFASVTGTFTDTSLSGDFVSSVEATAVQPRVGLRFNDATEVWIGGYFIDAEESHSGTINLDLGPLGPGVPVPIDFGVALSQEEDFNFSLGVHTMFSDSWEATVEIGGGGDRDTVLANLTYRFE